MFHIPMKLKSKLARASMTTSDVNNQWRSNLEQQIIKHNMKALIELHFPHEALSRSIENVLRSTLSYPNETLKECIQFLNNYITSVFH